MVKIFDEIIDEVESYPSSSRASPRRSSDVVLSAALRSGAKHP
jgi:hypothetical protein